MGPWRAGPGTLSAGRGRPTNCTGAQPHWSAHPKGSSCAGPGSCLSTARLWSSGVGSRAPMWTPKRRTRRAALFQTAALLRWDPAPLVGLLRLDDEARGRAGSDLVDVARGVGPECAGLLLDTFLASLP